MFLRRPGLAAGLVALGATQAGPPGLRVEHTPPACLVAEKPGRLVACLVPRNQRATLHAYFRAEGSAAWYSTALRSDTPCFSGLLPRPNRDTPRVVYFIEAEGQGGPKVRTDEQQVVVVSDPAACPGRVATTSATQRASWEGPAGEPRVPPGFEGASLSTRAARGPATPPAAPTPAASTATASVPPPAKVLPPTPRPVPSSPAPATTAGAPSGGGHGLRNAALITAGLAAAGGAAVVVSQNKNEGGVSPPPAPSGTGLPATGVSGVYVGTETVNYTSACAGTDDIVLNLQESGGNLTGVLSFTVRTCACCSAGRGANPVAGSLAGTGAQLATPIGFTYSGSFAGNRLSGALAGPGSVTGTWSVDKR